MRFSAEQFEEFNRIAAREDDRLFAVRLRDYRPNLTNHLDDRALVDEVTTARASAVAIGLGNTGLRARFVMIHVLLLRISGARVRHMPCCMLRPARRISALATSAP